MNINEVPFMTVFMISPEEITPAGFNPAVRVEGKNLKNLLDLIREKGFQIPVALSRDGILGDGHRRVRCAQIIGLKQIPAIRYDLSVEDLYEMNYGLRKITDKEWMAIFANNGPRGIPPKKLNKIIELERIIGNEGIIRLVTQKISPYILSLSRSVANYCGNDTGDFLKTVLWWLVERNQQFAVRSAMRGGIEAETLEKAIVGGKHIVKKWDLT